MMISYEQLEFNQFFSGPALTMSYGDCLVRYHLNYFYLAGRMEGITMISNRCQSVAKTFIIIAFALFSFFFFTPLWWNHYIDSFFAFYFEIIYINLFLKKEKRKSKKKQIWVATMRDQLKHSYFLIFIQEDNEK